MKGNLRYIIWQNVGSERWNPTFYETEDEFLKAITCGWPYQIMLTKEIDILLRKEESAGVQGTTRLSKGEKMYLTEEEAKAKFCPYAFNIHPNEATDTTYDCVASKCMVWRWKNDICPDKDGESRGYCGLVRNLE